jgi:hypothetical protein
MWSLGAFLPFFHLSSFFLSAFPSQVGVLIPPSPSGSTSNLQSLFAIAAFTSGVLSYSLIVKRRKDFRQSRDDALSRFAGVFIGSSVILAVIEGIGCVAVLFRDSFKGRLVSLLFSLFTPLPVG